MNSLHRVSAVIGLVCFAGTVVCQVPQQPRPITISGLGTVTFPASTRSAAAESTFVRGVLLLHVYEYEDAEAQFRKAQALDSGMALAYWGEAMTHDHPVWDEEDPAAARAALARYASTAAQREARAPTTRERGFLHAVDLLFGAGPKALRDTLYSIAMDSLRVRYPADDEIRMFYAVSLLGLSQGVRNVRTYLRAGAIAESVFHRNPNHPGAAHTWIHAMDDPQHAAQALPAARALATISPDAGHAQHMTSHIFMALGMWDDVVRANVNAQRVVNAGLAARGASPYRCGHSITWLEYGYLELGRTDSAHALMSRCQESARTPSGNSSDPDDSDLGSAVYMWSRYVIDTKEWSGGEETWTPAFGVGRWARATWEFTRGLAAAERGDSTGLRQALSDFTASHTILLNQMASQPPDPENAEMRKRLDVLQLELEGELRAASSPGSGVALLRHATQVEDSMAFAFGPPDVEKPSHELLGDVLLGLGRYGEAATEYQAALRKAPGRVTSVEGLARARAEKDAQ